jgi:hypothetical protein
MIAETRIKREARQGETEDERNSRIRRTRNEKARVARGEAAARLNHARYHRYDIRKYADKDYEVPQRIRTVLPEEDRYFGNYYF